MTPFVRGATLSNYAEIAAQVGLDAGAMLRDAGIDRRVLTDSDMRIPARQVMVLLEDSAARSGCETFGLRMAESRALSDFGAVSLLITHQATMRDALMTVVQYRQLLNPSLLISVDEHPDVVIVREELLITDLGALRQSYELAIGVLYRLFRTVLGTRWRALSANFMHAPPADMSVHRRIFGPICRFGGDFHGLTCSRADLDAPNPSADPRLAQYAERFVRTLPNAEQGALAGEVQKAIHLLLPIGQASIDNIAATLGLNTRTLQRRLEAEEADFTQLLNQVRRGLAVRYVANDRIPLGHVCGLLGYSRQTSFNRWFAGEFSASPTAWRERDKEAAKVRDEQCP